MKANLHKTLLIILIAGTVLTGYFYRLVSRPIDIISVHEDGNYSYVLVKNFPITDKGKIN